MEQNKKNFIEFQQTFSGLPTFTPTYLPTYLLTYLLYLPTYLPTYWA